MATTAPVSSCGSLSAGVGRTLVEPALGTPVGGWGARAEHDATGRHSELTVTAIALRAHDQSTPVVIVGADVVLWPGAVASRVRAAAAARTGVPAEAIQLAASHTHASVMMDDPTIDNWEHDGLCAAARDLVETQTVEAVAAAVADLRPARYDAVRQACPVTRSRRQRISGDLAVGVDRPIESAHLDVISFTTADGAPLASIVVYGMHPTVLAWGSLVFSPDYVGELRRVVEQGLGGPCMFLQGCGADRAPARSFANRTDAADAVGAAVGYSAVAALLADVERTLEPHPERIVESGARLVDNSTARPSSPATTLRHRSADVAMSLRPRDLTAARERVEEARAAVAGGDGSSSVALARAVIELDISQRFPEGDTTSVPVDLVALGRLALVFWPGELAGDYERLCQGAADRQVVLVTNANDYVNYLPAPHQFAEGGYEVDASPFTRDAADDFLRGISELIDGDGSAAVPNAKG